MFKFEKLTSHLKSYTYIKKNVSFPKESIELDICFLSCGLSSFLKKHTILKVHYKLHGIEEWNKMSEFLVLPLVWNRKLPIYGFLQEIINHDSEAYIKKKKNATTTPPLFIFLLNRSRIFSSIIKSKVTRVIKRKRGNGTLSINWHRSLVSTVTFYSVHQVIV